MPIKSIENQLDAHGILGNLPRWGKLRKGDEKPENGIGPDLDFFRLTLEAPYAHLMDAFIAKYGDKPMEFRNVFLAANSADDAFQYWYEHRAHARIEKRCDGEEIILSWNKNAAQYDHTPHACTCDPLKPVCKHRGKIDIVLQEFCREVGEWGKLTIETGSFYDIIALRGAMKVAHAFAQNLPGSAFWSIPFRVGRSVRVVPVTINGKRSNKPMSLLFAEAEKEFNHAVFNPMLIAPTQALLMGVNSATGEIPEVVIEQAANWDRDYVNAQTIHLFDHENHQEHAIDQMISAQEVTNAMTDDEVISVIRHNRDRRQAEKQSKKAGKNAPKPPVEGSNSSAVDEPDASELEWVSDTKMTHALLAKASKDLAMDHGAVIQALQWAGGNYTIQNVAEFVGTKAEAWGACIVHHCGYDPDQVKEFITDENSPGRISALALLDRIADIPF